MIIESLLKLIAIFLYRWNTSGTANTSGSLTGEDINQISSNLINGIQLTNFSDTVNLDPTTSFSISKNLPATDSQEWQQINGTSSDGYIVVQVADRMEFHTALEPLHEGVPFKKQPKIQVLDNTVN